MDASQQAVINDIAHNNFFRKKHGSTLCFAAGILLFLLPFAEFKCGSMSLLGNTGIGIAAGQQWKITTDWNKNELMDKLNESKKTGKNLMKEDPNIFAIAALLAGLFGIVMAFTRIKWRFTAGMCAGILGAVMLLALLIQFKLVLKSMLNKESGEADKLGLNMGSILKVQFTFWYYLSLLSFMAAAFLNYMRDKLELHEAIKGSVDFEFQKKENTA